MKKSEVQKLQHGLYHIYWKGGGSSLASIGSMPNGDRWMSPTNWISPGTSKREHWKAVKYVCRIYFS